MRGPAAGIRRTRVAALVLLCLAVTTGCAREHQSVIFLYEAICPACEESQQMEALAGSVIALERSRADVSVQAFNVYEQGGMEALVEARAAAGLESSSVSFPLLIVGAEAFQGEATVRQEIDRLRAEE